MKRTRFALLAAVMALGCTPVPGQMPAASFMLGGAAGGSDDTTFLDASGQRFSLQSLGVTTLLVRYNRRVRGQMTPPGGVRAGALPRGTEIFRFESPALAARALQLLQADPLVELAEPDVPLQTMGALGSVVSTDVAASQAYMLDSVGEGINASAAWFIEAGDAAATSEVAVLDSGVDTTHDEFGPSGAQLETTAQRDFTASPVNSNVMDNLGHGTQVAGLIVARNSLLTSLIGVAPFAKVLALKVGDVAPGSLSVANVVAALNYATTRDEVRVINLSLGTTTDSNSLREAVEAAVLAGKVVVAAAGNAGSTIKAYPAAYPGVLSVGASAMVSAGGVTSLQRASFSNYGPWVGIMAPGSNLWTTDTGGGYVRKSGTSMAAPLVSGAAALVRARCAALGLNGVTSEQVRRRLMLSNGGRIVAGAPHLNVGLAVNFGTLNELPPDNPPQVEGNRAAATLGAQPHSEIRVRWNANEPVRPMVLVREQTGTTQLLVNQVAAAPDAIATGFDSSRPDVTVSGLQPGKLYNYIVVGQDEANNVATASFVGSIRTKALTGSTVAVTKSAYSPVLRWTTNFPANRTVRYGTDPNSLASSVVVTDAFESSHQVVLPRLQPNTTYYYRIEAVDSDNFASIMIPPLTSATPSFRTDPVVFEKPVLVSHTGGQNVSWSTSVPGQAEVWYGSVENDVATTGVCANACQVATSSDDVRTAHAVTVNNTSTAPLFLRPVIRDGDMVARGPVQRTVTPLIKALELAYTDVVASQAILAFRTDRLANVSVAIATAALPVPAATQVASFTFTPSPAGSATHFRVPLTGLAPRVRYFAWVRLEPVYPGGVGNATVVPAGSFFTPAQPAP